LNSVNEWVITVLLACLVLPDNEKLRAENAEAVKNDKTSSSSHKYNGISINRSNSNISSSDDSETSPTSPQSSNKNNPNIIKNNTNGNVNGNVNGSKVKKNKRKSVVEPLHTSNVETTDQTNDYPKPTPRPKKNDSNNNSGEGEWITVQKRRSIRYLTYAMIHQLAHADDTVIPVETNMILREMLFAISWLLGSISVTTYLAGILRTIPRIRFYRQKSDPNYKQKLNLPSLQSLAITYFCYISIIGIIVTTCSFFIGYFEMYPDSHPNSAMIAFIMKLTEYGVFAICCFLISFGFIMYGNKLISIAGEGIRIGNEA
ncbi:10372_t:CDS:2, partial [Entrophospora sp. SA101]